MYNYVYRPFFVYPQESGYTGIPKASRYEVTINFKLTLNKAASGGNARAFAELFFLGNGNGKPEPSLATGSFDTNDSQSSDTSTTYNNASNSDSSIGVFTNKYSTAINVTKQLSITFDNESTTSNNVVRYQLGLFVGCNYASSRDHTTSATVEMSIHSVVKNDLLAQVGSNYYTTMFNAMSAFNNAANQTLTLLNNASINSSTDQGRLINKTGTFNLNGFTLSTNNYVGFYISSNASVTFQNGNVVHTSTQQIAFSVQSGSTLTLASTVTVTSSGNGCINNSGTVVVNGVLSASKGYALTNTGTATLTNATLTTTGDSMACVYNEGTLNINASTLNAKSGGKSLYIRSASAITRIYGASSLPRGISVGSGYKAQRLYLYNGSTTYSGSTISMTFDEALVNNDIPFYAYNSSQTAKISITNSLASYLSYSYNSSTKAYMVKYNLYTITVTNAHGSYTISKSSSVTYDDTVNLSFTLDEGYRLVGSGAKVSCTNCSYTNFDTDNYTLQIYHVNGNATITINSELMPCALKYDGNGTSSVTTDAGKDGYHTASGSYTYTWGETVTVLNNAFRKSGYLFLEWNTQQDGNGITYEPGDTFVIHEGVTLYAQWIDADYATLDEFVFNYMHLNDYVSEQGYCISYQGGDGYYIIAKRALVALSANQINVFRSDARYSGAKDRYEAWARANEDISPYEGTEIVRANVLNNSNDVNESDGTVYLIVAIAVTSVLMVSALIFIKRRRFH